MRCFFLLFAACLAFAGAEARAQTTNSVVFPPDNCDPNNINMLTWQSGHNVTCKPMPSCDSKSLLTWNGAGFSCKKPKLACTQAYRHANDGMVVESGDAVAVTQVGTSDMSGNNWGLACTTGYEKTGCHLANDTAISNGIVPPFMDYDLQPSANACLSDDEESAPGAAATISIICCKLDNN